MYIPLTGKYFDKIDAKKEKKKDIYKIFALHLRT